MATYDLLMLAILIGLTLYGYFKGMAWQVAYIASFVASYFIAVRFADQVAPKITFVNPPANKFVAMLLIYAAASLGVWMVFRVVRKGIDSVKMEGFDHQMGAILGFGRGVLWCVGVTFFALTVVPLPPSAKQQIVNTKSGYYIARVIDQTHSLFPPEFHQVVGPYLDRLGNELEGAQPGNPSGGGSAPVWPNGFGGAQQQPAQQSAPVWGQQPAAPPAAQPQAAPAWGATQPATPAWGRQASSPAPASASDFGWPTDGAAQPATPAAPASWPKWDER